MGANSTSPLNIFKFLKTKLESKSLFARRKNRKVSVPRIELGTFCVLDRCDNHYTTLTFTIRNEICSENVNKMMSAKCVRMIEKTERTLSWAWRYSSTAASNWAKCENVPWRSGSVEDAPFAKRQTSTGRPPVICEHRFERFNKHFWVSAPHNFLRRKCSKFICFN